MKKKQALLAIDLQYDFLPGGSLAVNQGDQIIPIVNKLLKKFDFIVFTQDFHPSNHISFASQHPEKSVFEEIQLNGQKQMLWPDHCVQNTHGAEIHADVMFNQIKGSFYIFKKGMDRNVDSYSAFFDNDHQSSTGLAEFLKQKKISEVFLCGLATDFCVAWSAEDAVIQGFNTNIIIDACRGINSLEQITNLLNRLKKEGIKIITSKEI